MPINGCKKGKAGEREVINLLQPGINELLASRGLPPVDMKRNLVQSRSGGCDIVGLPGWALEVKRVAKVTPGFLDKAWEQAKRQAQEAGDSDLGVAFRPALVYRGNQRSWAVRIWVKTERHWCPADVSPEDFIQIVVNTIDA